jgi:hypothetical protein
MGPQISQVQKIPGLGFPENPGSKRLNKSRDFGIPICDQFGKKQFECNLLNEFHDKLFKNGLAIFGS